jgi:5-methylcytosine-specific restriction endonuclease McrBC GTP-binding regulatory subunit McrB
MTTIEIANRLVELIRAGEYETAHQELYAQDAISIENPIYQNDQMSYKESKGMDAIKEKGKQWMDSMEQLFGQGASEPLVIQNGFTITIYFDAIMKGMTERIKMEEIAVYWVKDGKIVREEFFY